MPALRDGSRVFPWLLAVFFAAAAAFFALRLASSVRETRRADAAPVVQAMRKIAQLATVEAEISDVMRFEELKSFLVFDFPKSATIRMRGKVVAGFDLTAPQFHVAAQPEKRRLSVSLPPPRILALDPRLEWFDEDSGILNPITPQDRTRWMLWARGQLARGEELRHRGARGRPRARAARRRGGGVRVDGGGGGRGAGQRDARAESLTSSGPLRGPCQ